MATWDVIQHSQFSAGPVKSVGLINDHQRAWMQHTTFMWLTVVTLQQASQSE